jgi:hypothetical protein
MDMVNGYLRLDHQVESSGGMIMAVKLPRIQCPSCPREVAGLSTTRIGMLSVKDHKLAPHDLVLCPGSEQHVQAPDAKFIQEQLEALMRAIQAKPAAIAEPLF